MVSKAFFKPSVAPKLCYKTVGNKERSIEVWLTTCIVTNFGKSALGSDNKSVVLVNPSNPQLYGVRNFPYFPRGGPVPSEKPMSMHKDWQPLGFVSQWGGMEVGTGMMYPISVIDGLVHLHGGWKLRAECKWKQTMAGNGDACPIGSAVMTTCGSLHEEYDAIVHTTPPFFKCEHDAEMLLAKCYQSVFETAFVQYNRVAMPLIGAGCRGFPEDIAVRIAAEQANLWCKHDESSTGDSYQHDDEQVVAFALLEQRLVDDLISVIEKDEKSI